MFFSFFQYQIVFNSAWIYSIVSRNGSISFGSGTQWFERGFALDSCAGVLAL